MPSTQSRHLRRGAMLPLVAMLLPVLLVLSSFAINQAYMELTRIELRIAADAASRAGSYRLMTTGDQAAARTAARDGAARNLVGGRATELADDDIVFGVSRRTSASQRYEFTPNAAPPNAVSVSARRTAGSLSGAVSLVAPTFGAVDRFGASQVAISTQAEVDIVLVLDRSGSMAFGDLESSEPGNTPASAPPGWKFCDPAPSASRWRGLLTAVEEFLDAINASPQREFVSLVTYSDLAQLESTLSSDYSSIPPKLDAYTQRYCMGKTNIHAGISAGVDALTEPQHSRPWAAKVLVVLTDGRRTAGADPVEAAQEAYDLRITVHAVTFALEADQTLMQQVAAAGGGVHYHVATGDELQQLFRAIAQRLPTLLTQ